MLVYNLIHKKEKMNVPRENSPAKQTRLVICF